MAELIATLMGGPRGRAVPDRKARKAGTPPAVHPVPCLTHYRYGPFILTNRIPTVWFAGW